MNNSGIIFSGSAVYDSNNLNILMTTVPNTTGTAQIDVSPAGAFTTRYLLYTTSNYSSHSCYFGDNSNTYRVNWGQAGSNTSVYLNSNLINSSNLPNNLFKGYVWNNMAIRKSPGSIRLFIEDSNVLTANLDIDASIEGGQMYLESSSGALGTAAKVKDFNYIPIHTFTEPCSFENTVMIPTLINSSLDYSSNAVSLLSGSNSFDINGIASLASNANLTAIYSSNNLALAGSNFPNLLASNFMVSNLVANSLNLCVNQDQLIKFDYQSSVLNYSPNPPVYSNLGYNFFNNSNNYHLPLTVVGSGVSTPTLFNFASQGFTLTTQFQFINTPFMNERVFEISNSNDGSLDCFRIQRNLTSNQLLIYATNSNVTAISNVIPNINQNSNYVLTCEYTQSNFAVWLNSSNVLNSSSNNLQNYIRSNIFIGRGAGGQYASMNMNNLSYYPYVEKDADIARNQGLLQQPSYYWSFPNDSLNDSFYITPSNVYNRSSFSNVDSASFSSNVNINSNLTVTGNIINSNTLSNLGNAAFRSNVVVSSNLTVVNGFIGSNGMSNLGNASFSSNVVVLSNFAVNQNFFGSNTLSNIGNVYCGSNVQINSNLVVTQNISACNVTISSVLSNIGPALFSNSVSILGPQSNFNNVFIASNLSVASNFSVTQNSSFNGVGVTNYQSNFGSTSLSSLTVTGNQSNNGSLTLTGAFINPGFNQLSNSFVTVSNNLISLSNNVQSFSNSYISWSNIVASSTATGSAQGTFASNAAFFGSNTAFAASNTAIFSSNTAVFGSNAGFFGSNTAFAASNAAIFSSNAAVYGSNAKFSGGVYSAANGFTASNTGRLTGVTLVGTQPGLYMVNTQSTSAWDMWVSQTAETQGNGSFVFYDQTNGQLRLSLQNTTGGGALRCYSNIIADGNITTNIDNTVVCTGNRGVGFVKQQGTYDKLIYNNVNPFTIASVPQSDISSGISTMTPTTRMTIDTSGNTIFGGNLNVTGSISASNITQSNAISYGNFTVKNDSSNSTLSIINAPTSCFINVANSNGVSLANGLIIGNGPGTTITMGGLSSNDGGQLNVGVPTYLAYFGNASVGIGNQNPKFKLDVTGSFNATSITTSNSTPITQFQRGVVTGITLGAAQGATQMVNFTSNFTVVPNLMLTAGTSSGVAVDVNASYYSVSSSNWGLKVLNLSTTTAASNVTVQWRAMT